MKARRSNIDPSLYILKVHDGFTVWGRHDGFTVWGRNARGKLYQIDPYGETFEAEVDAELWICRRYFS